MLDVVNTEQELVVQRVSLVRRVVDELARQQVVVVLLAPGPDRFAALYARTSARVAT